MSNEELEDDVVLAKFINYMQKALYHMRLNYFRDYERMRDYEVELEEIECPNSKDVINEDISIIGVLNDTEIKLLNDVRIDIWTHFMRECIIDYVH